MVGKKSIHWLQLDVKQQQKATSLCKANLVLVSVED